MRSDITLAYRKEQRGPGPQGRTYIFFNREKYSILTVSVTQLRTYSILGSGPLKSTFAASRRPSDLTHTVHCRVGKARLRTTKPALCRLALNSMASNREGEFKWS